MRLVELTLEHALSVTRRMRALDRACISELLGDMTDEDFAIDRYRCYGPAWALVDDDGHAWAIAGLALSNGWTGVFWLVVADGLPLQSWRNLIRQARIILVNGLDPQNEHARHRIEAYVLADWPEAQLLVQQLGMTHEGTRRAAGRSGTDIQVWATLRRNIQR